MKIRHPKERGEWAEIRFMAKATEHGFKLTKPWGDSSPYDFVLDLGGRFASVQVKSISSRSRPAKPHHRSGAFVAHMRGFRAYRRSDFDYLAVYVIPKDIWYIIPVAVAIRKISVRVWPGNQANRYERYREAWHLFDDLVLSPAPGDPRLEPLRRHRRPSSATRTKARTTK